MIVEDVTTSGKSIRETFPIITAQADISVAGMMVSLNRLERGLEDETMTALDQLQKEYNFPADSIVTMNDVMEHLYNKEVNGKVNIDDEIKARLDAYYAEYGVVK